MNKIAFVINFSNKTWNGGYNFFKNLIFFLKKYKKKVNIVIITDQQKNIIKKNFKNIEIIETSLVSNKFNLRFLDKILILLFGKSLFFENFLIKNNIEFCLIIHFVENIVKLKFSWFRL